MASRMRKPTARPQVHKPRANREEEITAHVANGLQLPRDIAQAMGCSTDLVMRYARTMPAIVRLLEERPGYRSRNVLALAASTTL